MIVSAPGVAVAVADAACASLDKQVNQLRAEGKLDAGQGKNMEIMVWTDETIKAAREFKKV